MKDVVYVSFLPEKKAKGNCISAGELFDTDEIRGKKLISVVYN